MLEVQREHQRGAVHVTLGHRNMQDPEKWKQQKGVMVKAKMSSSS